jgi:hypothetical protein
MATLVVRRLAMQMLVGADAAANKDVTELAISGAGFGWVE